MEPDPHRTARRLSLRYDVLHRLAECAVLHVIDDDAPGAPPVLTLLTTAPDRDGQEALAILEGRHQNHQDMSAEQVGV